ncbi:MAG: hypothetical protein CM1200mP41_28000 [Gammaproteobacteria bacterium]|nr:MAG: hypothetical protein CM1200mP41_28000 [Gammaproteobacteria bacterium]
MVSVLARIICRPVRLPLATGQGGGKLSGGILIRDPFRATPNPIDDKKFTQSGMSSGHVADVWDATRRDKNGLPQSWMEEATKT